MPHDPEPPAAPAQGADATPTGAAPVRRILLVDCDAYFVQVAKLEDPEGAGRTEFLLVGGSADHRGVITSASYECRPFGVRSGMPTARALRLCPRAVVVPVPREACSRKNREIRAVLERFAPVVVTASIDEFYLDLTGTEQLYGGASLDAVARRIREAVLAETSISVSVGGGTSKLIAKIASRRAKPGGVHVVPAGGEAEFMLGHELGAIPGIGPRAVQRLADFGLRTVADVVALDRATLSGLLGEGMGAWLYDCARGIDTTPVVERTEAKSVSREETFAHDINDDAALARELLHLVVRVAGDLRREGMRARTITVKLRDGDFTTRQASRTLPEAVESDRAIHEVARELLGKLRAARRTGARLLGISLSHLCSDAGPVQLSIFEEREEALETERDRKLAHAVDALRARFGRKIVLPGKLIGE